MTRKEEIKNTALAIFERSAQENRDLTKEEWDEIEELKRAIEACDDEEEPEKEKEEEEEHAEEEKEASQPDEEEERVDDDEEEEQENKEENKRNNNSIMKEFRLINAINDIANNRNLNEIDAAVVKLGQEELRNAGLSAQGQIQLSGEKRAVTVANADGVVETQVENILAPLRDNMVIFNAGAKLLTNLKGDVKLPVMGASSVTWEGEVASAKDGSPSITAKALSPKRLTAYVEVSKQFLMQDSADAEATLRNDIVNAVAEKLQQTILGSASGTTTQPAGIFYGATVTSASTFADICDIESKVDDANVGGNRCYVMSNKAKAGLRNMAKSAKSTQLIMENGEVDGTPAYATSSVEDKKFAYGDFSYLTVGQWSGLDIVVDQYTKAKEASVVLVINAWYDAVVTRPEAIAFGTL